MKLERLLGILIILLTKERVTANYLSDYFEVSKRTIYRDLDSLDVAGLPIATFTGRDGGIEIFNNYKLDKHLFLDEEKELIISSLNTYKKITDNKKTDLLIRKIQDITTADIQHEILKAVNILKVSSLREPIQKEVELNFNIIEEAIKTNKTITFTYVNYSGESSQREVEPIQLRMDHGIWYLNGYCLLRNEMRVFKTTRMADLLMTEKNFEKKALADAIATSKELESDEVFIKFKRNRLGQLLDYFTKEEIIEVKEGFVTVKLEFKFDYKLVDLLLYFGSGIIDIKPEKYRKDYEKELTKILSNLKSDNN